MQTKAAKYFTLALAWAGLGYGCGPKDAGPSGLLVEQGHSDMSERAHAEAERSRDAAYMKLATGRVEELEDKAQVINKHPWPVQLKSIGHTGASYQNYGGQPYFHMGLDMRADAGSEVLASAGGKVVNVENYLPGDPAYWEVAILDDNGFIWQYHHIERSSIPQQVLDAFRNGTKIADGAKLGQVYFWSMDAFGERYHHIHVNVLGADKNYVSPFLLLEDLPDTKAPKFVEIGVLKNGQRWSGRSVSGQYALYAEVHDLVLHDKFVVPAHKLSYKLDGGDEVVVWNFDKLPGGGDENKYVHDYFVKGLTCGNYQCRKLFVNVGFSPGGTRYFPTAAGQHNVELIARDYAGNETRTNYSWRVE